MPPTNPPTPSGKPGDPGGSRPGKADWRGKAKVPGAGVGPSRAKGATWREQSDLEYRHAKRRYRRKLVGLLLGFVALVAWLAYLYVYPLFWRQTPFFAVVVTQYAPSSESLGYSLIPPNAWAQEDVERFGLFTDKRIAEFSRVDYAPWQTTLEGFQDLREGIRKSRGGGPGRNAMVVYLSIHGAVNRDGEACVIPPGVSPLDSQKWLPLHQVLRYLFPEDDKDRLPAKKLLILDCNRMDAAWGLGLLYNGFADDLEAAWKRADVPGLVILNSTSPGQIGSTSPEEFQGSVFGYYVWRGLMGWADREGGGNRDGQVSVSELQEYVGQYVRGWVQGKRADVQTPMLVPGDADDFALVYALTEGELAEGEKEWAPPAAQRDPRWKDVADLWARHAELEKQDAWRNSPLGWEEFQHGLLRLEQLVVAGSAYRAEFDKRKARLADLAKQLGEDPVAPAVRAYSLPLACRLSGNRTIEAEADRLRQQWTKTPGKFAVEGGRQPSYLVAATAGWQWCLEHPEGERWPDDLSALIRKSGQGRKADVIQWHFVRMLQDYLDPEVRKARPDLVRRALLTRQAAESAAMPADQRVHYWLHRLVDEADENRRLAEDALFVGNPAALQRAEQKYAEVVGKDASGGKYAEAQARAKSVADAFALRDRVCARAPYLAEWVLARLHESDPAPADELLRLIQAMRQLGRELDNELAAQREGASPEAVPSAARASAQKTVEDALATLQRAFQNECSRLSETTGVPDREIMKRISIVLATPLVTGEDRRRLRGRYLDILESGWKPQPDAGADAQGPGYRVAAGNQPAEPRDRHDRFLTRLARWGEHPALAMLGREGLQENEPLAPKPAGATMKSPAGGAGESERAVQELRKKSLALQGDEVRRLLATASHDAAAWGQETEAKLRLEERTPSLAEIRSGASKADRLLRASAAMLQTELTPWSEPGTDPVSQLRRLDLAYLLSWQAHRTLEDFWGTAAGGPSEPSFFDVVAGEYLASAKDLLKSEAADRYGKSNLRQLLESRRRAAREAVRVVAGDVQVVPGDPTTPVDAAVSQSKGIPPGEAAVYLESDAEKQVLSVFSAAADAEKAASPGLRRVPIAVPGGEGKSSYWVRSGDFRMGEGGSESKDCQAVALYRGHRLPERFTATPPGAGVRIVFEPPQDPKQWITVKGDVKTEGYVVFILDYSASMLKRMSLDPTKQKPGQQGRYRYEEARDTLLSILHRLSRIPGSPYRAGVVLYGHRVNYASLLRQDGYTVPPDADLVKRNPKNRREFVSADSDRIHPSEDIQRIWPTGWPPGALTEADVGDVRKRLGDQMPMGETPVYLAIIQAIDLLNEVSSASPEGAGASRHIVVITDGVNFQSERKVGAAHVADKFTKSGRGIRLDIVGYLMTDANLAADAEMMGVAVADVQGAVDDLRKLAKGHGGDLYPARDTSSLETELERSLRLSRYVVYREGSAESSVAKLEPKDLSEPWPVPLAKPDLQTEGGVPYVAKLVDPSRQAEAKVRLQGGEAILLHLSEEGNRLEHERYKFEIRESRPDVPDRLDRARRLFIAAHEPEARQGRARFFFSIQNQDERAFSPRPAESWVEIRPILKGPETAPLYVFYDEQFKPDCPVPVLECTASAWPKEAESEAREAEVRLWCKFTRTPTDEILRLDQFAPKKRDGLSLELRHQSDEKQDRHHVIVTERHARAGVAGAAGDLNALKIEMSPQPLKAVHHYIREAGRVRHTFSYPLEPFRSGQVPPYVIRVTLREEAVKDAIRVDPPLRVRIPWNTAGSR